jgi:hypothetical protein
MKIVSDPIRRLLFEAYRRNEMCLNDQDRERPFTERWLGLGTEPVYRPVIKAGLMKFVNGSPPSRCMGWLVLTEKGVNVMQECAEYYNFAKKLEERRNRKDVLDSYNLAGGLTTW